MYTLRHIICNLINICRVVSFIFSCYNDLKGGYSMPKQRKILLRDLAKYCVEKNFAYFCIGSCKYNSTNHKFVSSQIGFDRIEIHAHDAIGKGFVFLGWKNSQTSCMCENKVTIENIVYIKSEHNIFEDVDILIFYCGDKSKYLRLCDKYSSELIAEKTLEKFAVVALTKTQYEQHIKQAAEFDADIKPINASIISC